LLRNIVSGAAARFAEEQLRICANQLAAVGDDEAEDGKERARASADSQELFNKLRSLIECIGMDEFGRDDFLAAYELAGEEFGPGADVMSVLWQNGIIGYALDRDRGQWHFYALSDDEHLAVPTTGDKYAFWTAITDWCPSVKIVSPAPILPMRTFLA